MLEHPSLLARVRKRLMSVRTAGGKSLFYRYLCESNSSEVRD